MFYGAEVRCPECGEHTVPRIAVGTAITSHGYEQSFGDFRQFTMYHVEEVAPLLRRWFGCELVKRESSVRIRTGDGADFHPLFLHALIQADPEKQYEIYQLAMNLWH